MSDNKITGFYDYVLIYNGLNCYNILYHTYQTSGMIHLFITLDGHAGDFSLHTSITIYAPQAINRMHPNYPDKADRKKRAESKGQHDRSLLDNVCDKATIYCF